MSNPANKCKQMRKKRKLSKIKIKIGYLGRDLNRIITKTDWNIAVNCKFVVELSFRNAIQNKRFVESFYSQSQK